MKLIHLLPLILYMSSVFAQNTTTGGEAVTSSPAIITTSNTAITTSAVASTTTTSVASTSSSTTTTSVTSTSSSTSASASSTGDCLTANPFSSQDYFPNKLDYSKLDSSAQFNVSYANTYKLVHNLALDEYYVLYCTSAAPNVSNTFQSKTFIQIPVKSFAAIDTRALGYLDLLGQSNNIAYVGNVTNVTSPCGTKTPAYFNLSDPNLDRTLYDLAVYPGSSNNDPKGVGFGLSFANTPLGNAQWVKYFALFTNQEQAADSIFTDIQTDYTTYRDSINAANHIAYKRNITFMDYDALSTKFNILQDQYFQNLTSDAGAVLLTPPILQPGDPSTMKGELQNASLVIDFTPVTAFNSTYANWQTWLGFSASGIANGAAAALSTFQETNQYINSFDAPPFERNNQLWRLDLVSNQGALDYWTRGMARPDLLIQDLIQAQFPDYFKSRTRSFMRSFATNETTHTAPSADIYGCNFNSWVRASSVDYSNASADQPGLTPADTSKLSLGLIIGGSVAGGFVALACLATAIVLTLRKIKHNGSKRFTLLHESTSTSDFGSSTLRDDPMMMSESHETSTGHLGGSGRDI